MSQDDVTLLQEKLKRLEMSLSALAESSRMEVELARKIQSLLMPQKTKIPSLESFGRYLSSGELCSEFYDVLHDPVHKKLWFIGSWCETYGLSALLLHAWLKLRAQSQTQDEKPLEIDDFFQALSQDLTQAKRETRFSLLVAGLNLKTLELTSKSIGTLPLLLEAPTHAFYFHGADSYRPEAWKERATTADISDLSKVHQAEVLVTPGTRIYYLGTGWAEKEKSLDAVLEKLQTQSLSLEPHELIENFNHLMMRMEDEASRLDKKSDVLCFGCEISQKFIRLLRP